VKVNCGGLPDQLLEAELFGAEPGAYTGATKLRVGRFEEAHGGTLFLDEIGNLSLTGQAKLLRVLQLGEYQRLGSNVTRKVDVRVISATNVNLRRAIQEGTFREDLYFRLAVIEVGLPALKDRPEDVPVLHPERTRATTTELMNIFPVVVHEDLSVPHAAAMMAAANVHRVLVVARDNTVVGILTTMDVVRWLARKAGYAV